MVGKFLSKAKAFMGREKFEEKVVLKEIEVAHKIISDLFGIRATQVNPDTANVNINIRRGNMQEMKRKLQQARGFILDAKKHDNRLVEFGRILSDDFNLLPPQLKTGINMSEQTEMAMGESIVAPLNIIAQQLITIQAYINEDGTWNQGVHDPIARMYIDFNIIIGRIKEIFRVHAKVAEALKAIERM